MLSNDILSFNVRFYSYIVQVKEENRIFCVARLDHMRNEQKYFKLLNSWAKELAIAGKLFKIAHHSIIVVLLGENRSLNEFLKRWRSQNVDIDSRGHPCKEKMLTILCQQSIKLADLVFNRYILFLYI